MLTHLKSTMHILEYVEAFEFGPRDFVTKNISTL